MNIAMEYLARFCFGYPFVMSCYWITGSIVYWLIIERHQPRFFNPPKLSATPLVSVLLPCFNESQQLRETMEVLMQSTYPNFEVIAINDGSSDDTGKILVELLQIYPRLRVAQLAENQGKSTALNTGLLLAKGNILVCIDGDALLDPHAIDWFVSRFLEDGNLGAITGNPRIRNRSTLLGKIQVGEFSSIVGMIKRTQSLYGKLFTVSGVICAFRKLTVIEAGLWNPAAMTDDVDLTLRLQTKGWDVGFEPSALCWILMPEKLIGLWRQRVRWSEGGALATIGVTRQLFRAKSLPLYLIWSNFFTSTLWAFCMITWFTLTNLNELLKGNASQILQNFVPHWWGTILASIYLLQSVIGLCLDSRYEKGMLKSFGWIIWYPLAYWCIQTCSCAVGVCKAILRKSNAKGTWISPDRGLR
jgi:biofilm PGA synthesis N-glycosyltransferase PgaC